MSNERFLGLTKPGFLGVVFFVQLLIIGALVFSVVYTAGVAAGTRTSLCAYKEDLEGRHDRSLKFLSLTLEERIEEYGPELGNVPESTIQQSVSAQEQTLESLSSLTC